MKMHQPVPVGAGLVGTTGEVDQSVEQLVFAAIECLQRVFSYG